MLFFVLTVYILLFTITGSHGDLQEIEKEYMEMQQEDRAEPTAQISITDAQGNEASKTLSKNELYRIVGKGFSFYNNHYTAIFMLTLPIFLFATRAWYGKNNRKRYLRAEYLVAIAYSMVMVVLYRCLGSLVYLISPNASETMGFWIPLVIVVAFTACFKKMMGFNIAKTAWRSLLAVVLYYIVIGFLLLSAGIVAYLIIRNSILTGE